MYTVTPEKRHGLSRIKRDRWFLSKLEDQGGLCTDEDLAVELVRRHRKRVYEAVHDADGSMFVQQGTIFYPHAVGASFAAMADTQEDTLWDLLEQLGCNREEVWPLRSSVGVTDFRSFAYVEEQDLKKHGITDVEIDAISRALSTYEKCISWWAAKGKKREKFVPEWMRKRLETLPTIASAITSYMEPLRETEKKRRAAKAAAKAKSHAS